MKSWAEYVDLLKPAADMLPRTTDSCNKTLEAKLYQQFAMMLSQGYFLLFQSTPDHPEFAPFENSVFLAQPNPDAVYYYAPVEGTGTYRVTGERGTAPVTGFAVGNRVIGMAPEPGKGLGNYDMDALDMDADGRFEVIFSSERPAGHDGNWLYLPPEADFILARQFSYDWGNEDDMRLAIERVDAAPVRPPLTAEEIDHKLSRLFGEYVRNLSGICLAAVQRVREAGFVNRFRLNTYQDLGNGEDWPQAYFETFFEIAEDEALILETELPEERPYWNVQVIDPLWNQVELVYCQSSLNGRQARVDSDGRFRAVLSHQDPGIHNWLATGGNTQGMMIGRWYRCSSQPEPRLHKVKLADIRAHLPADTPHITPEERAEALRHRRLGAQLRRRW